MSLLCHFGPGADFDVAIGDSLSVDRFEGSVTNMAIADIGFTLCSQRLLFAGRSVLLNTNSAKIARYAADFFPQIETAECASPESRARITVHVRESDDLCESAPWFRARGHFAFASFTLADAFWFNLRTREVYGLCTPQLADDSWRWYAHIFPALLGILSAVIGVAPVHAACVVRCGYGTLLTGPSGTGKSTLTIALAKRGYELLSDEWTYLCANESAVVAWGLPVPVKLLPDTVRFFPEVMEYSPTQSLNGETAYEVFPEECFGVSRRLHCSVKAIVVLERAVERGCEIVPISASEAIDHLSRDVEPLEGTLSCFYERQLRLIAQLGHVECLRVSFNDSPDSVARALDTALAVME